MRGKVVIGYTFRKNAVWLLPILPHSWTQIRKKKKKKIWITQFNFQQKHCKKQKQNLSMKRGTLKSVCCMIQGVWIQHIQEANDSAKPSTTVAQSGYPTFSSLSNPTEPFFFLTQQPLLMRGFTLIFFLWIINLDSSLIHGQQSSSFPLVSCNAAGVFTWTNSRKKTHKKASVCIYNWKWGKPQWVSFKVLHCLPHFCATSASRCWRVHLLKSKPYLAYNQLIPWLTIRL